MGLFDSLKAKAAENKAAQQKAAQQKASQQKAPQQKQPARKPVQQNNAKRPGNKKNEAQHYTPNKHLFPISRPWGYSPQHVDEAIAGYTNVIENQKVAIQKLKEEVSFYKKRYDKLEVEYKNCQIQLQFTHVPSMTEVQEQYIQDKFHEKFQQAAPGTDINPFGETIDEDRSADQIIKEDYIGGNTSKLSMIEHESSVGDNSTEEKPVKFSFNFKKKPAEPEHEPEEEDSYNNSDGEDNGYEDNNYSSDENGYSDEGHSEEGYSEDTEGYSEDSEGYSEEGNGYSEDSEGYSEDSEGNYSEGEEENSEYSSEDDSEDEETEEGSGTPEDGVPEIPEGDPEEQAGPGSEDPAQDFFKKFGF